MTKQKEIREWVAEQFYGGYCEPENKDSCEWQEALRNTDQTLVHLHSQGAMLRVKCPDCNWSQFAGEESVGMTPCYTCNSTGYIYEPLIEEGE